MAPGGRMAATAIGGRAGVAGTAAPWILACSLLLCSSPLLFQGAEGAIGVNYGMIANNLPSPDKVISMYKANNINYVRLFHPDTTVLTALRGTGIGVVLGTLNEDLARLASDQSFAASWVASYVKPFAGTVTFRYITAGNEVIPGDLGVHVLPAIRNLEAAMRAVGVTGVPVTTAVATSVLGVSYPPSQGAFSEASAPVMVPLVSYLLSKKAPLLVNVYPYFAYAAEPETVQLGYALLAGSSATSKMVSVTDGGLVYTNMFDAIVDAAHAAVDKAGAEGAIGVNYGMIANNLPSPDKVISMYKANNINYVRLFHPDTTVLTALRGTGIGVVLGTLNEDLARLASDQSFAASWVASYVKPFAGTVTFRYITAGNEVIPGDLGVHVLPAIRNLEAAMRAVGVTGVPVTTAVATSVLGVSYPPSQGAFSEASAPVMVPLVSYLLSKKAPLLVNVYPYFAYAAEPETVQLGYALLAGSSATSKMVSVTDGGLVYTNMFDAIVDAAHAAVDKAGAQGLELVVSETGWWPSGGGATGATVENAAAYNNNVVRHVASGAGTPRRPGKAVETYLFAMFNENQKPEGTEQHFGLFQPDMTAVYPVEFTA